MSASGFLIRTVFATSIAGMLLILCLPQVATAQIRVGVFDSRAIALVRYHCPDIENPTKALHAQLKAAKEAGDEKEIARVKRLGPLHQAHLHDLVFGSGSVNAYFDELKETLATIAKEENLQIIVSKWETAFLAPGVFQVDITDTLVEFYHPSEKVRAVLSGMKEQEPVKDALYIED